MLRASTIASASTIALPAVSAIGAASGTSTVTAMLTTLALLSVRADRLTRWARRHPLSPSAKARENTDLLALPHRRSGPSLGSRRRAAARRRQRYAAAGLASPMRQAAGSAQIKPDGKNQCCGPSVHRVEDERFVAAEEPDEKPQQCHWAS